MRTMLTLALGALLITGPGCPRFTRAMEAAGKECGGQVVAVAADLAFPDWQARLDTRGSAGPAALQFVLCAVGAVLGDLIENDDDDAPSLRGGPKGPHVRSFKIQRAQSYLRQHGVEPKLKPHSLQNGPDVGGDPRTSPSKAALGQLFDVAPIGAAAAFRLPTAAECAAHPLWCGSVMAPSKVGPHLNPPTGQTLAEARVECDRAVAQNCAGPAGDPAQSPDCPASCAIVHAADTAPHGPHGGN